MKFKLFIVFLLYSICGYGQLFTQLLPIENKTYFVGLENLNIANFKFKYNKIYGGLQHSIEREEFKNQVFKSDITYILLESKAIALSPFFSYINSYNFNKSAFLLGVNIDDKWRKFLLGANIGYGSDPIDAGLIYSSSVGIKLNDIHLFYLQYGYTPVFFRPERDIKFLWKITARDVQVLAGFSFFERNKELEFKNIRFRNTFIVNLNTLFKK